MVGVEVQRAFVGEWDETQKSLNFAYLTVSYLKLGSIVRNNARISICHVHIQ